MSVEMMTLGRTKRVLDVTVVDGLRSRSRGRVLTSADDGYDAARRIWNAMIDKRPALIVRCAGAADVLEAVRFAAAHELLLSVRGGGHNVAGTAVCDGGLMIDMSPMKGIRVDPVTRTAWAQPGSCGRSSTTRRKPSGSRPPAASWARPGSPGSRSAGAWDGWCASTGSPATIFSPPTS